MKASCPFCESFDLDHQVGMPDREGTPICVACVECGATGPWAYGKDEEDTAEADHLWNMRAY